MPRRVKLKTREKGMLEVLVVTESTEGEWESGWESLRDTFFGQLIPRVPRAAFNHVLNGFSQPFIEALGLPPQGALQRVPSPSCAKQAGCSLYDRRRCFLTSKRLPWCYEPAGFDELDATALRFAKDLIFLWKEGVHVVAVYGDG